MLEISVAELFYIVLMFFVVILGTLLTLILYRALKVVKVVEDVFNYYWEAKGLLGSAAGIPSMIFSRIQNAIFWNDTDDLDDTEVWKKTRKKSSKKT